MDYYFLEIKIEEFLYNSNELNLSREFNTQKTENIIENKYMNYELIFELKESKEKFVLKIINDKKKNKTPFTKNIILPTLININNKNFKNDFLNIYLYSNNSSIGEKHKLIDIDKGKLIDISCIQIKKYYNTKIGNFSIKFSYQLIIKKYSVEKNINNDIKYHKINSDDFFDINVDIFEEEEKEEEDYNTDYTEKSEKNPFELVQEINPKKFYRNTHMSLYKKIHLDQPILKEIIKDNLIECFLITGLSILNQKIKNSENYISQCNHKNFCEKNNAYNSQIFFRLQKPNSIFEKIDSNLIKNLIFPNGIKICYGYNKYLNNIVKSRNCSFFKKSNFSYNILTDINGNRYYIYSIIFFIKFNYNDFSEIYKDYKDIEINNYNNNNIFIPFSFSIISKIFDVEIFNIILKDLFITFNSSEFNSELFDNELIHLIFEIPFPTENSKLKIFLPNSQIEIYSHIYKNEYYNSINIFDIIFQKYSYNINFIIKIFILCILEKRIILHSSNMNKIFLSIEAILSLIYPLKWIMTYIPLIPDENINLILESFLPFIIGMTTQTYLNYSFKINKNDNKNNWDNIFIIDLDKENISPNKISDEIINSCPIYQFIIDEYVRCKNNDEINDEKLNKIFFDGMILLLEDIEKFTSKLGDNVLFNQKMFLEYKVNNFKKFYQEMTSSQQFFHFINEYNNSNENLYYEKFRENIKLKRNSKSRKKNAIKKIRRIYIDDYYLYPYFFEKNYEGIGDEIKREEILNVEGDDDSDLDLFNFEDEIDLYYNCLEKEDDINYLLDTEAFLRIKLILKNYIPENLRKYEIIKEKYDSKKIKQYENLNNYDSNASSELDYDIIENTKNILGNIYGKVKKSLNNMIQRKSILIFDENKENISTNSSSGEKVEYRRRNSLIKMIRENANKNELLKYKEQIIDLLKDYIGYILSNQNQNSDIEFSTKELSKLLKYRRIRRELSKIIYQKKFEKKIEHELSEETFDLLYQSVFFCLRNVNDNKNEYKTLQRIIKSMFYYYKRKIKFGKIYLYQKFLDKSDKFFFKSSLNFWKDYYKLEIIDNENNNDYHYDKIELINKIKNDMFLIEVDDNIVNFFQQL